MRLTLTPTDSIERINGQPCRRWEGVTEDGTPVHAWIATLSPQTHDEAALAAFDAELKALPQPVRAVSYDYRFFMD